VVTIKYAPGSAEGFPSPVMTPSGVFTIADNDVMGFCVLQGGKQILFMESIEPNEDESIHGCLVGTHMFGKVPQPFCVCLTGREILEALVLQPTMTEETQDNPFFGTIIPRIVFKLKKPIQILDPGLLAVELGTWREENFPEGLTLAGGSRTSTFPSVLRMGDMDTDWTLKGPFQRVVYAQDPELNLDAKIVEGTLTHEHFAPIKLDSPHLLIPMMHRDRFQVDIVPDEEDQSTEADEDAEVEGASAQAAGESST